MAKIYEFYRKRCTLLSLQYIIGESRTSLLCKNKLFSKLFNGSMDLKIDKQ